MAEGNEILHHGAYPNLAKSVEIHNKNIYQMHIAVQMPNEST